MKTKLSACALVLSLIHSAHAGDFCAHEKVPEAHSKAKADIEKRIESFAGKKGIALQADAMLSKLITAKSPIIVSWLKSRDLDSKSEEEIARAWRGYFARNFILSKYPHASAEIDGEIEKLVDETLATHLDKAFNERIESLFARAKKDAVAAVQAMEIGPKKEILARIEQIKLYWPKSLKAARNNTIPLDLIDWGIAYDPVPNEINIGLGALAYPNDETYLAVFAHEIGHAFDSCRWGAFFSGPWPFEKVGQCLRSEKSVGAKKRDDAPLEKLVAAKKISSELALALKQNPTCNKLAYPPPGIQADQLPESFADWFSAEVMARMPSIEVKNLRQDLCDTRKLREGSSYPSNVDRLGRIYLAHPKLKSKLDGGRLGSNVAHCGL